MKNFKSIRQIGFLILPLIIIGVCFLLVYENSFTVTNEMLSRKSKKVVAIPYDDRDQGGNSSTAILKAEPTQLSFTYMLGNQNPYPYAGIHLEMVDGSFMDLSDYDHFRIKIKSKYGTRIPFAIFCDIPGHSRKEELNSSYHLQYMLLISDEWTEKDVSLKNYIVPNWWYQKNKKTEKDFSPPDLAKVRTLLIGNCTNVKIGLEDQVEIAEITFYKDLFPFYSISGLFLLLYFASCKFRMSRKKTQMVTESKAGKEISFQYEKLEAQHPMEKEEEVVFNFITTNYSNPELTIVDVQNGTGIHERKLSAIIKNKTELNFKQFLNKLRITEAKRLLQETDLQVSDIALKTGYSNVSHFNRVFKNLENLSPNDFRKKNK